MLAQAHAQTTALPKNEASPANASSSEEKIGLRFTSQKKQTAVGGKAATVSARSVHGHAAVGAEVATSAWEETKAQHQASLKLVPGLSRTNEEAAGTGAKESEAAQKRLAASKGKASGLSLNGRAVTTRADGSPLVLDENGTALTTDAQDPDRNLGVYLAKEGKNALEDGRLNELLRSSRQANAQKTNDAFVESSAAHKATSLAQHAANVSEGTRDPKLTVAGTPETTMGTAQGEKAEAPKNATSAHKKENAALQKERTEEEAQGVAKPARASDESSSDALGREAGNGGKADKALLADALKSARTNPLAGGHESVAPADGAHIAQAITKGDAPLAAARLAELLGARLELLARGNERSLTLTLTPRELGEIRAQLVTNGETTDLHLKAEKETVGQSLEAAVPELSRLLQKAGVSVGQISIEYGLADFAHSGNEQAHYGKDDYEGGFSFEKEAAPQAPSAAQATRVAHANDNGVIDVVA